MSGFARRLQQAVRSETDSGDSGGAITHGEQLALASVGPWNLQTTAQGSESLEVVAVPSRGYFRGDAPEEFIPNQTYIYNDDPANKGGTVPAGGLTIDGYFVPAGTMVCQFQDLSGSDMYFQGMTGTFLFRGCRFRNNSTGDSAQFNVANSGSGLTIHTHYCDFGGLGPNEPDGPFIKMIGGSNHRVYRCYFSYLATAIQPNVQGMEITENIIDKITYYYGEAGTSGAGPDSTTKHLNGISTEGGLTSLIIQRNRITVPSPDESTAAGGTNPGQPSYGSQSGQLGYGSGSNPGRLTTQTDCIALFTLQGDNIGDDTTGIQIKDNYLGGSGYCLYGSGPAAKNNVYTGNKFTTKWWTDGANHGPYTGSVVFGSNGNVNSGNVWTDDYGTGGDGCTALTDRQYPAGDGPRIGQTAF
jgi:hypothetical protein